MVEDAADDSYRLRVYSTLLYNSDPSKKELDKRASEKFENRGNVLETDDLGTIKGVALTDGEIAEYRRQVEFAADYIYESVYDDEFRKKVDKETFRNKMVETAANEHTLMLDILKNFAPLYNYHGGRYELDREYSYSTSVPSMLNPNVTVPADATFWVKEIDYDNDVVYMQQYVAANPTEAVADAVDKVSDMVGAEVTDQSKAMFEQKSAMELFVVTAIHLNTGWPLGLWERKEFNVDGNGGIVERTIRVIDDEE